METSGMTALQKLVRVAEISDALLNMTREEQESQAAIELKCKRAAILGGVHFPPADLIGNPDPQAWAEAFSRYFFEITPEASYAWLSNAMLAGAQAAQTPSYEAGRAEGLRQAKEGFGNMADLLGFIRAGVDAGKIRSPLLVAPDALVGKGAATGLSEMIARALQTAGLE